MRFFGELRFKQLTLLMAVLGISAAAVFQNPDRELVGWLTVRGAVASFVMLFTGVTWIMEVRSTTHWMVHRKAAPEVWPRHSSRYFAWLNSTNAVAVFLACVYGFAFNCAWTWGLPRILRLAFGLLGVLLAVFTIVEYSPLIRFGLRSARPRA